MNEKCKAENQSVNETLAKSCDAKVNVLKSCNEKESSCGCFPSGELSRKGDVDLVLLIDSSSTMTPRLSGIDEAVIAGFKRATETCKPNLRDSWFWVDGPKGGSSGTSLLGNPINFTQSHQKYLESLPQNAGAVYFQDLNEPTGHYPGEEGADAIADIAKYFDWRPGACRSILYISDTTLEGHYSTEASNDYVVDRAITEATSHNVTVFAHKIGNGSGNTGLSPTIVWADYVNLCSSTGGYAETGGFPSPELYEKLIEKAICNCGEGCTTVPAPEVKPCISISWGDSDCDGLETDDFEILCISVCNCYSNIGFNNFNISRIEITDSDGNVVANLPDGTPSVQAVPIGPICFGTIGPCEDGEVSCVNREFVINTRGAKEGEYQVILHGICFDVNFNYHQDACFKFNLCKS